jgi:hypothetical protein
MLNPSHSYARRLLLMSAARHDPTRDLDGAALRSLNYEARKAALFVFFASKSERNIFARIRWTSVGALMRLIVRFLWAKKNVSLIRGILYKRLSIFFDCGYVLMNGSSQIKD